QYVAHDAAGGDNQCRLQLFKRTRGSGGATTPRAGETGGADSKIGDPRIPYLPRGWQETEDAEAAPAVDLQYDAGRVPCKMGPHAGLSDGCTKLRRAPL